MIVVTVFLPILNQMEIHLVQNRKDNCHYDHIPFSVKGKENLVFSVYEVRRQFLPHICTATGKTTAIRRVAVRENGVYRIIG